MPSTTTIALTFVIGLCFGIGTAYDQPAFLAIAVTLTVIALAGAFRRDANEHSTDAK